MRLSDFHIVYINLDKRPDKKKYIEDQLKKLGLLKGAIRFSGIDGSQLPKSRENYYLKNFKTMAKKRDRILGRIGCFLSHKAVLELAINTGLDNILILEDDCKFLIDKDIELPDPPSDAEIIYFSGLFWKQNPEPKSLHLKNLQRDWIPIDRTYLKIAGAIAYAIIGLDNIKKVYQKIIQPRPSAIDILYINYVQKKTQTKDKRLFLPGHCYIINPVIAVPNLDFPSDVTFIGQSKAPLYKNIYFYDIQQQKLLSQ